VGGGGRFGKKGGLAHSLRRRELFRQAKKNTFAGIEKEKRRRKRSILVLQERRDAWKGGKPP